MLQLAARRNATVVLVRLSSARQLASGAQAAKAPLVLSSDKNGVRTLTMNDPAKLNGWTKPMMATLFDAFNAAAADPEVLVLVLTGAGTYYCAGVNLAGVLKPMHPQALHDLIYTQNKKVFDAFLDFPKPLIAAVNGPAIGASVTTATLCDALLMAEETATLSTPFAKLGVPPEGCSSVHFPRLLAGGAATAARLLGPEGWQPAAPQAVACGLATASVPGEELLPAAQALGEAWAAAGKAHRAVPQPGVPAGAATTPQTAAAAAAVREEYKAVNDAESKELARAFLGPSFLQGQVDFLSAKGKRQTAVFFKLLLLTRPLWSALLSKEADIARHSK